MRTSDRPGTLAASVSAPRSVVDHMTTARVEIIDRSVEKAHVWISGTAEELGTGDSPRAHRVLRTFLRPVRDHFSVDEAAQLPIFVRGVFFGGWDSSRTPEHARPG